jgi:hypothetical protein
MSFRSEPYVAGGAAFGFTTGTATGLNSYEAKLGARLPIMLREHLKLTFQLESVWSRELKGQASFGSSLMYDF